MARDVCKMYEDCALQGVNFRYTRELAVDRTAGDDTNRIIHHRPTGPVRIWGSRGREFKSPQPD